MKAIVVLILLLSLVANGMLAWRRFDVPTRTDSASPNMPAKSAQVGGGKRVDHERAPEVTSGKSLFPPWRSLPTGDLAALAVALKEQGYPPHLVRGIIAHYLDLEYEARLRALREAGGPAQYWKGSTFFTATNGKLRTEMRSIARERKERLDALTGTDASTLDGLDRYSLHNLRQRYGDFPPATLKSLQAIEADYSELAREIREGGSGVLLPSDREKLTLLDQERRKDLQALLTPEQFEELELRTSSTAAALRRTLTLMEPTEQEFRTLHRLQKAYDETYAFTSVRRNDPGFRAQQRQAEQELIAAVKAELGPERGAAYEKSRDPNYVHAHTVARQLGLAPEAGDRLAKVQQDTFREFGQIGAAAGTDPEQRRAAQLAFIQEKKAAIAAIVGEANLPTYQAGMGGWINAAEQNLRRSAIQPGTVITRDAAP